MIKVINKATAKTLKQRLIKLRVGALLYINGIRLVTKVITPENIVINYEWYYNMYNAIEAQERNIRVMDISRPERLGAIMVLNNSIAEYNSKSAQITRNLWKSKDLPYSIPLFDK